MADYLIQDTTLDAIADAINAKTGGSSAMTPAQMVTAIGTIAGGGGLQYETGTLTTTGNKFSISHNLNTTKVMFFIVPINGNTYTASYGYEPFACVAANISAISPFTATLDYSQYHSTVQTEQAVSTNINIGINTVSPWTSQGSYTYPSGNPVVDIRQNTTGALVFGNNSVTGWGYNAMTGTYKYFVVSLEGVS